MLVQFSFRNVLSFKEETVFDMTAVPAYKEHESNAMDSGGKDKVLKVAAIYGANASGKSNLCKAMNIFQSIVMKSMNNPDNAGNTALTKYYAPFSFEKDVETSEFEIIQIFGDFEYQYGFEYNDRCIVSEWMYRKSLKTNRRSSIFERLGNKVEFGISARKECDRYKDQIPDEALILSFFKKLKLKTDIFEILYKCIADTLILSTSFWEQPDIINILLPDFIDRYKDQLIHFLKEIDTGIRDIDYEERDKEIKFITFHRGKDGTDYPLDLFSESEGTVKSIILFIYTVYSIFWRGTLFVDELDVKLHPLLMKYIVDLFCAPDSGAQLIYTTHDTTLMDRKFFRRDQIWFVQKDEFGYSELSALSDFKIRLDASFEKDYLAGVYGGIPFLRDITGKEA